MPGHSLKHPEPQCLGKSEVERKIDLNPQSVSLRASNEQFLHDGRNKRLVGTEKDRVDRSPDPQIRVLLLKARQETTEAASQEEVRPVGRVFAVGNPKEAGIPVDLGPWHKQERTDDPIPNYPDPAQPLQPRP